MINKGQNASTADALMPTEADGVLLKNEAGIAVSMSAVKVVDSSASTSRNENTKVPVEAVPVNTDAYNNAAKNFSDKSTAEILIFVQEAKPSAGDLSQLSIDVSNISSGKVKFAACCCL